MAPQVPFISLEQIVGTTQVRLTTTRRDLMAAFDRVIELSEKRQITDLHVRRLLNYVRAHDKYYSGIQKSIKHLANKLVLSESTCRRVIQRAVKHFGLLIVMEQRHRYGGQTVNRYTINWDQVDALLCDEDRENAFLEQAKQVAKDLSILAEGRKPSGSSNCPSVSDPGSTDVPVGSSNLFSLPSNIDSSRNDRATANKVSDMPVVLRPANEGSDMPVRLAPGSTDILKSRARSKRILPSSTSTICPSGSDHANEESDMPGAARTCPHTSLPNAMCWACRDRALDSGIKPNLGWMFIDSQLDGPIYYDQPAPPHLHKVFDRLARTPRPSNANLTPRGQTPPFPIKLPKGIPAEMLAHFDVLLAKAQAAIDCAQQLCHKRRRSSRRKGRRVRLAPPTALERLMDQLKYRLTRLHGRMEVIQFRASNPGMCRTYLPPVTPEKEYVWDVKPIDWTAISNEMAEKSRNFDWTMVPFVVPDPKPFDFSQFNFKPDALSNHPVDLCPDSTGTTWPPDLSDHPPGYSSDAPGSSPANNESDMPVRLAPSAVKSLFPPDSLESKIENLLNAIDELLTAIKAALRCAGAHRINWLRKSLISWRGRTKTIRVRLLKIPEDVGANVACASAETNPEVCTAFDATECKHESASEAEFPGFPGFPSGTNRRGGLDFPPQWSF